MRRLFMISAILFFAAIAILVTSVITGESDFGLFLIFPFIIGSGPIAIIGAIFLLAAIFVAFISFAGQITQSELSDDRPLRQHQQQKIEKNFGGVVMIGPIPIAFGSDRKIAQRFMIIGIILFIAIALILILSIIL